jgi:hypothetical protein
MIVQEVWVPKVKVYGWITLDSISKLHTKPVSSQGNTAVKSDMVE